MQYPARLYAHRAALSTSKKILMNLYLFYVVLASSFVTVIVGLTRYKILDRGGRALVILAAANCCQIMASYTLSVMKIRNLELLNDYRPVELVMIAIVFVFMVESKLVRRLLIFCSIGYVVIWIADKIYLDDPTQLNSRMAMLSRITAIIMSIAVLYSGGQTSSGFFTKRPLFWVGTAVLLYSSGTLLVLGLSNQLINLELETFIQAWQINWILLIMANLMYVKGLLCKPQRPT